MSFASKGRSSAARRRPAGPAPRLNSLTQTLLNRISSEARAMTQTPKLEHLYNLAQMGDMRKIHAWAYALEERDNRYRNFAGRLRELAGAFRAKAITALVEQLLRGKK